MKFNTPTERNKIKNLDKQERQNSPLSSRFLINKNRSNDRFTRICQYYNLHTTKEKVMFYLEPKLVYYSVAKKCLDQAITAVEYSKAVLDFRRALGDDIISSVDIWGYHDISIIDNQIGPWKYLLFDHYTTWLAIYGDDYDPEVDHKPNREAINQIGTAEFYKRMEEAFPKATEGLKYILNDYDIKLEEIPKTIGE